MSILLIQFLLFFLLIQLYSCLEIDQLSQYDQLCNKACLSVNKCQQNLNCQFQFEHCQKQCLEITEIEGVECIPHCIEQLNKLKQQNVPNLVNEVLSCRNNCFQMNLTDKKKFIFNVFPEIHDGGTLLNINCQQYQLNETSKLLLHQKKKVVFGKCGWCDTQEFVRTYFKSRCDFEIDNSTSNQPHNQTNNFYFKWSNYYQHRFMNFQSGKQIINWIEDFKQLFGYKDTQTLAIKSFDKIAHFKNEFNSSNVLPKTYLFNFSNSNLTQEEQEFMDIVKTGIWVAKDPYGQQGKQVLLLKNLTDIKKKIKQLKSQRVQNEESNKKFGFRVFALIISLNPYIILYQRGFISKCICDFDLNFTVFKESDKCKHITQRRWQKMSKEYNESHEPLQLTPDEFEKFLLEEKKLKPDQVKEIYQYDKKIITYSLLSLKDKLPKNIGQFQFLSADLVYDENYKSYLLEYNTDSGFYKEERVDKIVNFQLFQSMFDIILQSYENTNELDKFWKSVKQEDLGRWEITYNEATGYNILNQ